MKRADITTAVISQNETFDLLLFVQLYLRSLLIYIHQGRKLRGNSLLSSFSAWKDVLWVGNTFLFFGHSLH